MTSTWTIISYFLMPIGLLLIFWVEPGRVFRYKRKNGPLRERVTVMTVGVWWGSLMLPLDSGSSTPNRLQLLATVGIIGSILYAGFLVYREGRKGSMPIRSISRERQADIAGLFLLLLGWLNVLDHSANDYAAARHQAATIDKAAVYLNMSR